MAAQGDAANDVIQQLTQALQQLQANQPPREPAVAAAPSSLTGRKLTFKGAREGWPQFRRQLRALAREQGPECEAALERRVEQPPIEEGEEEPDENLQQEFERFQAANSRLYTLIALSCEGAAAAALNGVEEKDGHGAWQELCRIYQSGTQMRLTQLEALLHTEGLDNTEAPELYFARQAQRVLELKENGLEIASDTVARAIVRNLGSRYKAVKESLLYQMTHYTLDDVKERVHACYELANQERASSRRLYSTQVGFAGEGSVKKTGATLWRSTRDSYLVMSQCT